MARLSAKKEAWYSITGDEDKAAVKIQHLTPGEVQKINNETSRWLGKRENEEFVSELEYAPMEQMRRLRLASIIDWSGFYDENGNTLKCTTANKERYLSFDPELGSNKDGKPQAFSAWIDQFREEIAETVAPKEELEKP